MASDGRHGPRTIKLEELNRLGLDGDGNLYWNGRRVRTERRVSLRGFELFLAAMGAAAAVALAIIEVLRFFGFGAIG